MKKTILLSLLLLGSGILLGTKIYNARNSLANVFGEGETYFFIQEGVYSSTEIMQENTKNMNAKVVDYKDNQHYVYVGITKSETNAVKIKKIYEEMGYQVYIKEQKLFNEEFSSNVEQFDLLINSANDEDEILTITEVVLANYEEIIRKQ